MSADPTFSGPAALHSVAHPSPAAIGVAPTPAEYEMTALHARLETERSAGRALLSTVGELDSRLQDERGVTAELRTSLAGLRNALDTQRDDLAVQSSELWSELIKVTHELNKMRQRSLWQRVVNRQWL